MDSVRDVVTLPQAASYTMKLHFLLLKSYIFFPVTLRDEHSLASIWR